MSPFAKPRNRPYRSLQAALVILVVTLSAGSTAIAQAQQNPPPAEAASEPGQPPEGEPPRPASRCAGSTMRLPVGKAKIFSSWRSRTMALGADPSGTGLTSLANRTLILEGRLMVESPTGGPTRVRAELPWGNHSGG